MTIVLEELFNSPTRLTGETPVTQRDRGKLPSNARTMGASENRSSRLTGRPVAALLVMIVASASTRIEGDEPPPPVPQAAIAPAAQMVVPCNPDEEVRVPYFRLSKSRLVGGDERERSRDHAESVEILRAYSRTGDALVHLLGQRCHEVKVPVPSMEAQRQCKSIIQFYCKGEERLVFVDEVELGQIPETRDFRYVEFPDFDETRFDYALPIPVPGGEGGKEQHLMVNGRGHPWPGDDRLLSVMPFRDKYDKPLYLVAVTDRRILILPSSIDPPLQQFRLDKPAKEALIQRQDDTFLVLLHERVVVIRQQNGNYVKSDEVEWPQITRPRRSEISFDTFGGDGLFLIHRSDCRAPEGGAAKTLAFYAFQIHPDATSGKTIRMHERPFEVTLENADPSDCRVQLVPQVTGGSGAHTFNVHVFYNQTGANGQLATWAYGYFRRTAEVAGGRLAGGVRSSNRGVLSDRNVTQDKNNLYVLFNPLAKKDEMAESENRLEVIPLEN